jgi:hypothetical protein
MKITDIRFQLIIENINKSILVGEHFNFKLERDVYINLGADFIKLINKESWYTYNISIKIANYGKEFMFDCKFIKPSNALFFNKNKQKQTKQTQEEEGEF